MVFHVPIRIIHSSNTKMDDIDLGTQLLQNVLDCMERTHTRHECKKEISQLGKYLYKTSKQNHFGRFFRDPFVFILNDLHRLRDLENRYTRYIDEFEDEWFDEDMDDDVEEDEPSLTDKVKSTVSNVVEKVKKKVVKEDDNDK